MGFARVVTTVKVASLIAMYAAGYFLLSSYADESRYRMAIGYTEPVNLCPDVPIDDWATICKGELK